jgi:hypothetical protein
LPRETGTVAEFSRGPLGVRGIREKVYSVVFAAKFNARGAKEVRRSFG